MQKHTNNPMASSKKKRCARKEKAEKQRETKRKNMQQKRDMKLKLKDPEIAAAKTLCQKYMGRDIPAAPPFRDIQKNASFHKLLLGLIAPGWAPTLLQ